MDIEQIWLMYMSDFSNIRGMIGICVSHKWEPGVSSLGTGYLKVYVKSTDVMDSLPKEYLGVRCEYIISPDGLHPGCD